MGTPRPGASGAGRFAPSPTSDLHLGNLRTALLAWAFARRANLRFLIRIEDLDQQRLAAAAGVATRQLADLESLGLDWDLPVVRQSERLELYQAALAGLDVYECFCSRREVAAATQAPHDTVRRYPGTCARLSTTQRTERGLTRSPALRVRAGGAEATAHDVHAGAVSAEVDDFVVQRGDGTPAYHLAVVVDDGEQRVTQVTRGIDLLESSPRHVWLATQLGYPAPEYVHVGLGVNTDGERLSKRDGAVSLQDLRARGLTTKDVVHSLGDSMGVQHLAHANEHRSGPGLQAATQLLTLDRASWDQLDPWTNWTPALPAQA